MSNQAITLLTLQLRNADDVTRARQRARKISSLLKFDIQGQTKIATAVSEIARNAYTYAVKGKVEFCLLQPATIHASLEIRITDKGPGIPWLEQFDQNFEGGIQGARRIMDSFTINSDTEKGTAICMGMNIPKNALPITKQMLAIITHELVKYPVESISEEVQQQNFELLHALDLLAKARDELEAKVQERTAQLSQAYHALQQETIERKQVEKQMQKQQFNLAKSSRLSSMVEMGSALAHELNQPLTAITTFTQGCIIRLESKNYSIEEILNSMKIVAQQSERAGIIIHRMKNFVQQGKLSHEKIDINAAIRSVVKLMDYETRETNIKFELNLKGNLPAVVADKVQIEQVLVNLIRNAIEAMQEARITQPVVIVNTGLANNKSVEVDVIDKGGGFDNEVAKKILKTYFTTKAEGMGMGLSISRTIIEAYGGKLVVKSHSKSGAWFQFTLPIARELTNA